MQGLSIVNIHKRYDETWALAGVSFHVGSGETAAVVGPSGSGKSTLLGIIAGLEPPDQGEILWNGESLEGVPPHQRGFGLMFQDFALFPHKNVLDNIAFAMQMANQPKKEIEARVQEMLDLVGLGGFSRRDVNTLSGGEQQRVALARSLAPKPRLLMLDEPLGALDRGLRERLVQDLRKILRAMHQTALYITHDQEEAFTLAHRVVVLNAGRIEQNGSPEEIFRKPASVFVARFLGMSNLLPGEIDLADDQPVAQTPIGPIPLPAARAGGKTGAKVTLLLRPDSAHLQEVNGFRLSGVLREASFRGSLCRVSISVDRTDLLFDFPSTTALPREGERITLHFNPREAVQVFEGGNS
jgi:ABC-type Fe3+/spermidine/putrescine transport system ATPase subunit